MLHALLECLKDVDFFAARERLGGMFFSCGVGSEE
jgi:hypothetical protein